jgi:hypothetical protein
MIEHLYWGKDVFVYNAWAEVGMQRDVYGYKKIRYVNGQISIAIVF